MIAKGHVNARQCHRVSFPIVELRREACGQQAGAGLEPAVLETLDVFRLIIGKKKASPEGPAN